MVSTFILNSVREVRDYALSNTSLKIHAILDRQCDYEQTKVIVLFEVVRCLVEM
jgi:hypothetical protein